MPVLRPPPAATLAQHRSLAWRFALWSLLGFLLLGTAHAHLHRSHGAARATAQAASGRAGDSALHASAPVGEEHGHHQHSDDPLQDLLTLGHNHVSGTCPGLPPMLWTLAAAPQAAQPVAPWPECILRDSPPGTPFRPPIA